MRGGLEQLHSKSEENLKFSSAGEVLPTLMSVEASPGRPALPLVNGSPFQRLFSCPPRPPTPLPWHT